MTELFIYDASDVNRPTFAALNENEKISKYQIYGNPVLTGFKQRIKTLNPTTPFLLRGIQGDYEYREDSWKFFNHNKVYSGVKSTFNERTLNILLSDILTKGHDKTSNIRSEYKIHPTEKKIVETTDIKYEDIIWADKLDNVEKAEPYRLWDAWVEHPQGHINDLTIVFDSKYYKEYTSIFYQSNIELRKKALLGIIVSDTNPKDKELKAPLRYTLTEQNLEEVMKDIHLKGYFNY